MNLALQLKLRAKGSLVVSYQEFSSNLAQIHNFLFSKIWLSNTFVIHIYLKGTDDTWKIWPKDLRGEMELQYHYH